MAATIRVCPRAAPRPKCALLVLMAGCTALGTEPGGLTDNDAVDSGSPWRPDGGDPEFPDANPADGGGPLVPDAALVADGGSTSGCLAGSGSYEEQGPYETTTSPGPLGFTVFHPVSFEAECPHPIVAWGNGTGVTGPSIYAHLHKHAASWGVVVIASHSSMVGSGADHRAGIDWLVAENSNPASQFRGKLSSRAGVAGHSQGGLGASAASSHANVEAQVNMQGGGSPAGTAALLLTGTADFMNSSIQISYGLSTGPTFLASYQGADHISTPTMLGALTPGGIQYKRLYAAWFRCFLAEDLNACALFTGGESCGICGDPGWAELESKNMDSWKPD